MDQPRTLTLITDERLLDDVLRLAAAAGCELERVPDASAARLRWSLAPMVLLDEPAARACAALGLARRQRVVVVSRGDPPNGLWQHAVGIGAENVVALPDGEAWLVSALADATEGGGRRGRVLAVVGGQGGAGASVLATAVAVAGVRDGERVLLVDCDPLGGGLDLLLGAEEVQGLRWPDIELSGGRVPSAALRAALPAVAMGEGELSVLSCGRSGAGPRAEAVASVLDAGRRAGQTVVCDVPRYPTEAAVVALDAADLTVLLVQAQVRATVAASRVAGMLTTRGAAPRLVVRGPAPGGVTPRDVAAALGLPLLHAMRPQPGLARALDRGSPPGRGRGPLLDAARAVLDELHHRAGGSAPREVPA